jgi:hypothetical protein
MDSITRFVGKNPFGSLAVLAFINFTTRSVTDSALFSVSSVLVLVVGAFIVGVISVNTQSKYSLDM